MGQLFASVFKGAPPEHVKVEVGREEVTVCRHDMVYEDILATKVSRDRGREGGREGGRERERECEIEKGTLFCHSAGYS